MNKNKSLIKTITGSREASLVIVLVVLVAVISFMSPSFLSPTNLSQIFRNNALTMLMTLGMFCSGEDFDLTFGLMHTVEKSADILVKTMSMTDRKRQTITPEEFRNLAAAFGVELPEQFLYEK